MTVVGSGTTPLELSVREALATVDWYSPIGELRSDVNTVGLKFAAGLGPTGKSAISMAAPTEKILLRPDTVGVKLCARSIKLPDGSSKAGLTKRLLTLADQGIKPYGSEPRGGVKKGSVVLFAGLPDPDIVSEPESGTIGALAKTPKRPPYTSVVSTVIDISNVAPTSISSSDVDVFARLPTSPVTVHVIKLAFAVAATARIPKLIR